MDDKSTNWGFLILIFLFFAVFFGGGNMGNMFGFGGRGNYGFAGNCGCGVVSNCEVEKQGIIDSARTQYLVEQTSRNTQEITLAGLNALGTKIDYYEYQNLRDQLAAERAKNNELQLMAYIESKDCNINRRLDAIQCQMLKQPPIWGQSFVCSGESIPPVAATTAA